jgi:hypothetical protein
VCFKLSRHYRIPRQKNFITHILMRQAKGRTLTLASSLLCITVVPVLHADSSSSKQYSSTSILLSPHFFWIKTTHTPGIHWLPGLPSRWHCVQGPRQASGQPGTQGALSQCPSAAVTHAGNQRKQQATEDVIGLVKPLSLQLKPCLQHVFHFLGYSTALHKFLSPSSRAANTVVPSVPSLKESLNSLS